MSMSLRLLAGGFAAVLAAAVGALLAGGAAPAGAHACGQVRAAAAGREVAAPACHPPGEPLHSCVQTDPDVDAGAARLGASACTPAG